MEMEIEIFTLCDFAQDVNGKLTIVGTFDTIHASHLPAIHPTLSIVARLRFHKNELGKHSFRISILDGNNKEIIPPLEGKLDVQITPSGEWGYANIVAQISQLNLFSYGRHSVNLSFDGKEIKSLPFSIKKT